MKFLHLGDLHIGKSLGDFDLAEDQLYILNQILDIAVKNQIDAILIAGDVYDKAIPSEAAVRIFNYFLNRLAQEKIKTFIITGNHDSDERLNFGSILFERNEIYIAAKYEGHLYKKTFEDTFGKINIYLMPYVKASQVRHFFPEEEIGNYEDAVKVILKKADVRENERNILVAHQFVTGKNAAPVLGGSESPAVQNVGLVEQISSECFGAFDYTALGHIHSGQRVGREEVRYSGSMLKYSLSESGNDKSVPLVTVEEKGQVRIELVPLHPMRDLRHIKGRMEQLLARENRISQDDFIYVTLTDEEFINDSMGIFQQYYPNTVKIEYENSHTKELQQVDIQQITENKTFQELFSEFYEMVYGCEISEEELRVIKEVAREAGVADETD